MRDRHKSKRLDYRKAWRSCKGFSLEKQFARIFPESELPSCTWVESKEIKYTFFDFEYHYWIPVWIPGRLSREWWYFRKREWIAERIGIDAVVASRRDRGHSNLCRIERNQHKQILREAIINDVLDDIVFLKRKYFDWWD